MVEQTPDADQVEFVDEFSDHSIGFNGTVTKRTPIDRAGFALNVLPKGAPPGFVEHVVEWFERRYGPEDFSDRDVVGTVSIDADDPSIVFPIGLYDTIGFEHNGTMVEGMVSAIGHSGTLRVKGVGVVDVEPEVVVEVTERYDKK